MIQVRNDAMRAVLCCGLLLGALTVNLAFAQPSGAGPASVKTAPNRSERAAVKHIDDAILIVQAMRADAKLDQVLQKSKAVFLVPSYTRVALGVGGGGGAGVLLTKLADGSWSAPAFYHVGAISLGLQVGAQSGPAALLLKSSKALDQFKKNSNFSLNADAGLTVANWSVAASEEMGDIVAWSSNTGLFGNAATVAVSDVRFSARQTDAFYGRKTQLADIVAGRVKTDKADRLHQALADRAGAPSGAPSTEPAR